MSDSVPETQAPAEAAAGDQDTGAPAHGPAAEPAHAPAEPAEAPSASDDPTPLDVPRTPTGNAGVDAALERLGDVDHLATDGHAEVYEDVHGALRDALTALDARPGPAAPPAPSPAHPQPYRHRS
ncbi:MULTISPECIES: hypothetical protein [unclassified Streptomyces]|uniref:hypothetical protein n=1 Tax=unclassified Streptomyces TaxID=2593676 RepID=UPI002740D3A5|nr:MULTISPECIES: hypothetical protein [unclassified Streptomyces]